jgi:zinc transport system substrate-binding protein
MQRVLTGLAVLTLLSCCRGSSDSGAKIITVSIAPFKYFVREIAGDDFNVNVMVPSGANPHVYEPYPEQVNQLRKSVAYISNGFLGFEMAWLDRFYEVNKTMIRVSPGEKIEPIASAHERGHEGMHTEGADPHYWVSPKCAMIIASSVLELLCTLNPEAKEKYETNYADLLVKIGEADKMAQSLFSEVRGKTFMIFHPNLAYLARDYGLQEIAVEFEGKEPPPSRMKELIDLARSENLKTIFVQKEYDSRNAKSIANEVGAEVVVIDPLSEDWLKSTMDIITALHKSLTNQQPATSILN